MDNGLSTRDLMMMRHIQSPQPHYVIHDSTALKRHYCSC